MKIWTVTPNDDNGLPSPSIYFTKEDAHKAAHNWVRDSWARWFGSTVPCPDDWEAARNKLSKEVGFYDSIAIGEHDLTNHPSLQPDPEQSSEIANAFRNVAKSLQSGGELEIDDNALVSMGEDPGAYVAAWIWVDNEDAGVHDCDDCGTTYIEGGDSYCGQCADCADKAEEDSDDDIAA